MLYETTMVDIVFNRVIRNFFRRFCLANGIVISITSNLYGWYGNNEQKKIKIKIERKRKTISIAPFLSTHFYLLHTKFLSIRMFITNKFISEIGETHFKKNANG